MPIQFITPSIISSVANTQVTGTITASQIATVNASTVTTGTLPRARLPAGSVLQVVQGTTNTTTTISVNNYTDTTLSASITPTSATSKILVLINQQCGVIQYAGLNGLGIRLLRGSTTIFNPPTDGTGGPFLIYGNASGGIFTIVSISYLDSPATTSSTTYKTQGRPYESSLSGAIFQSAGASVAGTSVITLLEIAA